MRTLKQTRAACAVIRLILAAQRSGWPIFLLCLARFHSGLTACKKDATEAIETDANGYLCLKCGAKLYTDRSVFIGPKCPQCKETALMQTVGYYCEKDQHLTIRASEGDRRGRLRTLPGRLISDYGPMKRIEKPGGATEEHLVKPPKPYKKI